MNTGMTPGTGELEGKFQIRRIPNRGRHRRWSGGRLLVNPTTTLDYYTEQSRPDGICTDMRMKRFWPTPYLSLTSMHTTLPMRFRRLGKTRSAGVTRSALRKFARHGLARPRTIRIACRPTTIRCACSRSRLRHLSPQPAICPRSRPLRNSELTAWFPGRVWWNATRTRD